MTRAGTPHGRTQAAAPPPHRVTQAMPSRPFAQTAAQHSRRGLACFLSLTALTLACLCLFAAPAAARPQNLGQLTAIADKLTETRVGYGDIPALYRPRYDRTTDADLSMSQNDPVFIVMLPGGPRIYPQRIMVWHLVVNELIDDRAYAITYCPITGSLAAYDAYMGGLNLRFDPQGTLYMGNDVLMDRNSGSRWLQMDGIAFDGPLTGRGMPMLTVYWTDWGHAKRLFPQAPVLAPPAGHKRPYSRDPYGNYLKKGTYYDNDVLVYPIEKTDRRLPKKNAVYCLEYKKKLLAIDIAAVKKKGAVNFFLDEDALVAVHDRTLDVVRVYNRLLWQKPSLFVMRGGVLTDIGTGTRWDPATGKALQGRMQGAQMTQSYGMYSMWFAWAAMNPETLLIPGPGEVPEAVLRGGR